MRLTHLVIRRFRRFVDVSVNLDHKVAALVGPNEAGKSTVLDALERLNGGIAMQPADYPRGEDPTAEVVIEGWFLLSAEDRTVIGGILGAKDVRWLIHFVHHDGTRRWEFRPEVERDTGRRSEAVRHLNAVMEQEWAGRSRVDYQGSLGPFSQAPLRQLLEALAERLETSAGNLAQSTVSALREVAIRLEVADRTDEAALLAEELRDLADYEAVEHPGRPVYDLLTSRVPKFVKFTDADRTVDAEYDLNQMPIPPKGLVNLLWLAGTSVEALRAALSRGDGGAAIQEVQDRANERLRRSFHDAWTQSKISVFLRIEGSSLKILMKSLPEGYASIAGSSDGMKTFVALHAFVARHSYETKPVLLLDEAETHLHYDAQADLVRVLTRQTVASQVIYSTHSAGCLPQDLGTSIKPVSPTGTYRSTIRKSFWTAGPGLNTLMLALGSTTFAFVPSRYAVVGEGPADVVLLPSLLRAVTGREDLAFQVVPGISELTADQITDLNAQAQHVAYLVDSDERGLALARRLEAAGVKRESIVDIGLGTVKDLTLEDLIAPSVYAAAVNEELARSGRAERVSVEDLPDVRRAHALEQLFLERNYKELPNKVDIGGRIVEMVVPGSPEGQQIDFTSIVKDARKEHLLDVYHRLLEALGVPGE